MPAAYIHVDTILFCSFLCCFLHTHTVTSINFKKEILRGVLPKEAPIDLLPFSPTAKKQGNKIRNYLIYILHAMMGLLYSVCM